MDAADHRVGPLGGHRLKGHAHQGPAELNQHQDGPRGESSDVLEELHAEDVVLVGRKLRPGKKGAWHSGCGTGSVA